jgi:hypothetical protein
MAGHACHLEHPERFAKLLRSFLGAGGHGEQGDHEGHEH